jgi:hypothetical protein
VLDVEADLVASLAARAGTPSSPPVAQVDTGAIVLDAAQKAVGAALASDRQLVVVEGAAGAGKTTTLEATRAAIERQGHRLFVVTPTLKAARVASEQVGSDAASAAWLAYQHGYRWDCHGAWTRLAPGELDAVSGLEFGGAGERAVLRTGDLLLVDEAGMLDQDTAHALLAIADENGARVALMGDRHQLPAVGRGGVLDLAARWADPDACLTLDTVHRFRRMITTPDGRIETAADEEYARLSLAMRDATDPERVFDALVERGLIRVHASEQARRAALANLTAPGETAAIVADTKEQVAGLNAATRDSRIERGDVDDEHVVINDGGQRIGAGDRIATRQNSTLLGVANRDVWTVARVAEDGAITLSGELGQRSLPEDYVRRHVELAYASTVYAAQGDTVASCHLTIGDHTSAASAYVGMTRGRESNVAHFVANDIDEARDRWVATFARERADLGPAHAAALAAQEASRYAQLRPVDEALADLHAAWAAQAQFADELDRTERCRDMLADIVVITKTRDLTVPPLQLAYEEARARADTAKKHLERIEAAVSAHADTIRDQLQHAWDAQRDAARNSAQTVHAGPGRLGQHTRAVHRASEELARWSTAWQLYLPAMPTRTEHVAGFASRCDDAPRIHEAFECYARSRAEQAHPELLDQRADAVAAAARRDDAWSAYRTTEGQLRNDLARYGRLGQVDDPAGALADVGAAIPVLTAQLNEARAKTASVLSEPTLRTLPRDRIDAERDIWELDRQADRRPRAARPDVERTPARHAPEVPRAVSHAQTIGR